VSVRVIASKLLYTTVLSRCVLQLQLRLEHLDNSIDCSPAHGTSAATGLNLSQALQSTPPCAHTECTPPPQARPSRSHTRPPLFGPYSPALLPSLPRCAPGAPVVGQAAEAPRPGHTCVVTDALLLYGQWGVQRALHSVPSGLPAPALQLPGQASLLLLTLLGKASLLLLTLLGLQMPPPGAPVVSR